MVGFESQIAARAAATDVAQAAGALSLSVSGVAIVRRDSMRGLHVDPVEGFELPCHVLQAVDPLVERDPLVPRAPALRPGEAALVVSVPEPDVDGSQLDLLVARARLDHHSALWVTTCLGGEPPSAVNQDD